MRVHWTQNAVEHLVNIYEHIALYSPTYAKRMVDKITRRSEQIADQPLSGRKVFDIPRLPSKKKEPLLVYLSRLRMA